MPFIELNHTADCLFRCSAGSLNELFSETARAGFSVMFEGHAADTVERKIELSSDSLSNLLIDFLSELLFIAETQCLVLSQTKVNVSPMTNSLTAVVFGETFDREKHGGGTEIKGISRSGVNIIQNESGEYQVDIIFDV